MSRPLPDISFGQGQPLPDWRSVGADGIDDDSDTPLPATPEDVIELLGFDPLHLETTDEFEESKHPRGKGGMFASSAGGGSSAPKMPKGQHPQDVKSGLDYIQETGESPASPTHKISLLQQVADEEILPPVVKAHAQAWINHLTDTTPPPDEPDDDNEFESTPMDTEQPLHERQFGPQERPGWTKTSGPIGSNDGGTFVNKAGDKFYAKLAQTEAHARNEHLAGLLYTLADAPSLKPRLVKGESIGGPTGSFATATDWQDAYPSDLTAGKDRDEIRKHFATHAWLANWDAIGTGSGDKLNQQRIGGKMHSIDLGGSLLFRAQGAPKGMMFGSSAGEWDTLRNGKNANSNKVFGDITPEQMAESARAVAKIKPNDIFKAVIRHGPGTPSERIDLADKLLARRDDIITRANALNVGKVHVR